MKKILSLFLTLLYCNSLCYGANPENLDPLKYKPKRIFSSYLPSEEDKGTVAIVMDDYVIFQDKSDFLGSNTAASALAAMKNTPQKKQAQSNLTSEQAAYLEQSTANSQNLDESIKRGKKQNTAIKVKPKNNASDESKMKSLKFVRSENIDLIKDGQYKYRLPPDGCYVLENNFGFCTKKGHITMADVRDVDAVLGSLDPFFYEKDMPCKVAKFLFAYNFMIQKRIIPFHQYQLVSEYYPDFIRMLVFNAKNLILPQYMTEQDINLPSKADPELNSVVMFVSSKNDCGCVPYPKVVLYDETESLKYLLRSPSYLLAGEWKDGYDPKTLLLSHIGPRVTFYNIKLLYQATQKLDNTVDPSDPKKVLKKISLRVNDFLTKASDVKKDPTGAPPTISIAPTKS